MFHMIQSITRSRKSFCLMIKHLAVNHSLRLDTNYDSDSYESFDFPCSIDCGHFRFNPISLFEVTDLPRPRSSLSLSLPVRFTSWDRRPAC